MIGIRVNHNLEEVADYIEMMNNDIQQVVAQGLEMAKQCLMDEAPDLFGDDQNEVMIDTFYNGQSFTLVIDNIGKRYIYGNNDLDLSQITEYAESILNEHIGMALKEGGY